VDQALTLDVVPGYRSCGWRWPTVQDRYALEEVINFAYLGTTIERQRIRSKAIDASMTQGWTTPEGRRSSCPRRTGSGPRWRVFTPRWTQSRWMPTTGPRPGDERLAAERGGTAGAAP